jgi:hypothetical protein
MEPAMSRNRIAVAPVLTDMLSCRAAKCRALRPLLCVAWLCAAGAVLGQAAPIADSQPAKPSAVCVDPLYKVLRSATDLPITQAAADVAVGEYATIQFVFRSPSAVSDLKASIDGNVPGAVARFVGYVHVGHSYQGAPADVLKSPDKKFPDPLLEDKSIAVAANQNQPVWITVPAKAPGTLRGNLTLRWTGGQLSQPFTVHVHRVTLKKPRLWITNWWFSDSQRLAMLAGHKVEQYSDEYWKLIRQFADFMAEYHQNMIMVSPLDLCDISFKDDKWSFDFSRFDRMVQTFVDAGVVGRIEGGHIAGRSGDWGSSFSVRTAQFNQGAIQFTNLPASDPAVRRFYSQYLPALSRHLAERGWDKIYRQHLADEPTQQNAASYREIAKMLREFAPGLRTIDATQTRDLVGAVNTWVPILDHYHHDYAFFRERQKAGDEVWLYTCCGPTGNYANRFIELPLIKTRLLHWINFRYGAAGYLHWGFNFWNTSSPFEETAFQWPGGDQWIVYPKDGRLLSSIRLEAMRDGIADNELLSMLAERNPDAAQKLAAETIVDFDRYDTDVARFRARRLRLIEALERQDARSRKQSGVLSRSCCLCQSFQ